MPALDTSIDKKILDSAKRAFMQQGFTDASLREICKEANVTTGALYKRYANKEELFAAVLDETLQAIESLFFYTEKPTFSKIDKNFDMSWIPTYEMFAPIIELQYEHYDGFRLLLCHSDGSQYANFLHVFIDKVTDNTWYFFTQSKENDFELTVDKAELHLLITNFWTAIYQPIIHEFSKQKALKYVSLLTDFFNFSVVIKTRT